MINEVYRCRTKMLKGQDSVPVDDEATQVLSDVIMGTLREDIDRTRNYNDNIINMDQLNEKVEEIVTASSSNRKARIDDNSFNDDTEANESILFNSLNGHVMDQTERNQHISSHPRSARVRSPASPNLHSELNLIIDEKTSVYEDSISNYGRLASHSGENGPTVPLLMSTVDNVDKKDVQTADSAPKSHFVHDKDALSAVKDIHIISRDSLPNQSASPMSTSNSEASKIDNSSPPVDKFQSRTDVSMDSVDRIVRVVPSRGKKRRAVTDSLTKDQPEISLSSALSCEDDDDINHKTKKRKKPCAKKIEASDDEVIDVPKPHIVTAISKSLIMHTGLDPLVVTVSTITELCSKINGLLVDDPVLATHVIVGNEIKRTPKLMAAMNAGAPYILRFDWLRDSAAKGRAIALTPSALRKYVANDAPKEKLWGSTILNTIMKPRNGLLFRDIGFIITHGVCGNRAPPEPDMRLIIYSGGGRFLSVDDSVDGDKSIIVIANDDNKDSLCDRLLDLARSGPGKNRIYSPEFIFQAVMRQEIDWDCGVVHLTRNIQDRAVKKNR